MTLTEAPPRRHFLSLADLSPDEVRAVLDAATAIRTGELRPDLNGRSLVLLLEKPSLRTRVSFELGMRKMGGHSLSMLPQEVGLGGREPPEDVARVLSRYADVIAARVNSHDTLVALANAADVPVINALSDIEHPCQILADLQAIREHFGTLEGLAIAFIGDGNNVAASLALGCALVGATLRIASPVGYELPGNIVAQATRLAGQEGNVPQLFVKPEDAVEGADVVYTDVWASMGQEAEREQRARDFRGYQINPHLMELADPKAVFMHDLPAHEGEEISEGMLTHPQSIVFNQAENRMHAQAALIATLLGAIPSAS
ncbi:MAG: ornithine carbamoyltransferase [Dehalococcoidia bacterium]|nr:ornithine carbamoyltransferase [Dehalococcoidia bacterium]